MKLKFMRFDSIIDFCDGKIHTFEVHERSVFTRMVESLKSEMGEKALEPYVLTENERLVSPKGKLLLLSNLPELPMYDRSIEKRLYERISSEVSEILEVDNKAFVFNRLVQELNHQVKDVSLGMWGTYSFRIDWDLSKYLKTFGYGVTIDEDASFLDRCIRFFGLCVDIGFKKPLIGVNLKSFLNENDLVLLFDQAIFHGIPLLLLETWKDVNQYDEEKKIVVEQGFLEIS